VQITNYYAESSGALFDELIRQPLHVLCSKGDDNVSGPMVILVDGLDESLSFSGRTSIVRLLAACGDLPDQVRLILTSRPVGGVLGPFRLLEPFIIYAHSEDNQADIRQYILKRFLSESLRNKVEDRNQVDHVTTSLGRRSSGNILVISKVLDAIERGELGLDNPEALPAELQDLYAWFLERITRGDVDTWRQRYRPLLGVLAAAQEPVDVSALCHWTRLPRQQVIDKLYDLRELLDPALDKRYRIYHESVVDFLTGDKAGIYGLDAKEYHQHIARYYIERFVENREIWQECDLYGLRHLPTHLIEVGNNETLKELLLGFNWLQSKLNATDVTTLMSDYDFLLGDKQLHLVQGAIQMSAHVLTEDKKQLAGQLLGRLQSLEQTEIQSLLKEARAWRGAPWLRPLNAGLIPPGGPLLYTLYGRSDSRSFCAVTVSTDGRRAVSASNKTLKVWDLKYGQLLHTLKSPGVKVIVMSADGQRVVSVSEDEVLKVWDVKSGKLLITLEDHYGQTLTVTLTIDGWQGVSASDDGTLKVWDVESRQLLHTLGGHNDSITAVALSADGRRAILAYDKTLKIWNVESGQLLHTLEGHSKAINAVALSADGQLAVSASKDQTLKVWDVESARLLHILKHQREVVDIALSMDGRWAVSVSEVDTLTVWDVEKEKLITSLDIHTSWVRAVALSMDGRWAVSVSDDETLKLWDVDCMRKLPTLESKSEWIDSVALSPDGRWAVSAYSTKLKLWDVERGQLLQMLDSWREGDVNRQTTLSAYLNTLQVRDVDRDQLLHMLKIVSVKKRHNPTDYSANRLVLGSVINGTLKVWD